MRLFFLRARLKFYGLRDCDDSGRRSVRHDIFDMTHQESQKSRRDAGATKPGPRIRQGLGRTAAG